MTTVEDARILHLESFGTEGDLSVLTLIIYLIVQKNAEQSDRPPFPKIKALMLLLFVSSITQDKLIATSSNW